MKKKITVAVSICVAAVAVVGALFGALYKGSDGLTAIERSNVKQFLAGCPFEQGENGKNDCMPIVAAVGSEKSERNTYLGFKTQANVCCDFVEINLADNAEGVAVLADSFADAKAESVRAARTVEYLNEIGSSANFFVALSEYSSIGSAAALANAAASPYGAVISGVTENAVKIVKGSFQHNVVLCDYSRANRRSLEQIKADGADGIRCAAGSFSDLLLSKARKAGLQVWVDCGDDVYTLIKAMNSGVSGVITQRPELAKELCIDWSINSFNNYIELIAEEQ